VLQHLGGGQSSGHAAQYVQTVFERTGIGFSLSSVLFFMVLFLVLRSVFLIFQAAYVGRIQADFLVNLRCRNIQRLFGARYAHFLSMDTGYLANAFTREFEGLSFAFNMFSSVVAKSVFVLIYLAFCMSVDVRVTGITLAFGLILFPVVKAINQSVRRHSVDNSAQSAGLQSLVVQSLHHFKYFKATGTQARILDRIFAQSRRLGRILYAQDVLGGVSQYGFQPLVIGLVAAILFAKRHGGTEEVMGVLFILVLLYRTMTELLGLQQNYRKYLMYIGSHGVFQKLDAELTEQTEASEAVGREPDFSRPVRLSRVWLEYRPGRPVLKDISLEILPGSMVAFIGGSGAGKSTLANLLTGLLAPSRGETALGKDSYSCLDMGKFRARVGYITQESVIFNDTVLNNVTLWDENPDPARFERALERAHLKEFVMGLPEGPNALLGDNGVRISGGQRQRIAIARELYKDARLLILDEATSSLDSATEAVIQRDIDGLRGETTVVLIAHRLSTVKNSDVIFVMEEGRVVEQGSYNELVNSSSLFRSMLSMQRI
jgi:ABC-type multidrug transport system fused ATPase/permease subunit